MVSIIGPDVSGVLAITKSARAVAVAMVAARTTRIRLPRIRSIEFFANGVAKPQRVLDKRRPVGGDVRKGESVKLAAILRVAGGDRRNGQDGRTFFGAARRHPEGSW